MPQRAHKRTTLPAGADPAGDRPGAESGVEPDRSFGAAGAVGSPAVEHGGVVAQGLVKRFGTFVALDEVDFAVPEGTVVGLLGPNGAGKTTTIRILTTLLRPDGGRATVAGHDVVAEAQLVRAIIGLTGQYAAVDEDLTGRENLVLVGRLPRLPRKKAFARAAQLLSAFSLSDAA